MTRSSHQDDFTRRSRSVFHLRLDGLDGPQRGRFLQPFVDRLEKLVEHGACGLKIWKDLGTSLT